ncbi:MAG: DEAD/DEAH box helicase family protein [Candidatus Heimdallarchaeota archaeon]|nr:DEAD/DEAH box helicase family protein [Candidatus Heimdallarchaeota archaeon]MDH5645774.1 DEAD/DEAH box helicase family protein [Candidatus Heimdallarchaeota archaeon]
MSAVKTWNDYFPYQPRPLQTTFIKNISGFVGKNKHMILEAANGTGKTVATLAAILPYAIENDLKIIYMARTHSQMDRVIEELKEISQQIPVNGVSLRGRSSMCLNPMITKYAKNNRAVQEMCEQVKVAKKCEYFNNMKEEYRILPILNEASKHPIDSGYILDVSSAAHVCPAEIAKRTLYNARVIACSYLYLFDPKIRYSFLDSLGVDLDKICLVIDEAHNLPDMVNSITSDSLSSFVFNRARREARDHNRFDYIKFIDTCEDVIFSENKKMKLYEEKPLDAALFLEDLELKCKIELDDEFFEEMSKLGYTIRYQLAKQGKEPRSSLGRVGEFFFQWFDSIGKKDYTQSLEKQKLGTSNETHVIIRLDALDPSQGILPVLKDIHFSISISGTIGDTDAYSLLTGINKLDYKSNILPSPYDHTNISAYIVKEVTTTYNKRSPAMWNKIINLIIAMANETPANVGLFTPSYAILKQILNNGLEKLSPKPLIITKEGMSSEENDKKIKEFKNLSTKGGAILCAVLGGRSSEGADFPGDLMNSVAVVGIPYAPPNCRVDAQIKYLDSKFPGKGRTLAYQIPAINRASQAAGRPVRGLSDRAFILLLDYRYGTSSVTHHLPEWLKTSMKSIENDPKLITAKAREFFA